MSCRCEPHASGSNRCDSCKDAARYDDGRESKLLTSAVVLIQNIAGDMNGVRHWAGACDAWLERNGFECQSSRRRQREQRAARLDAEIERLRAERAKL